jgi:hypothetical protein
MEEDDHKLRVRLVGRDGRRRFDPASKNRLVAACLEPGVSVSRLALEHGVNANLLRLTKRERPMPLSRYEEPIWGMSVEYFRKSREVCCLVSLGRPQLHHDYTVKNCGSTKALLVQLMAHAANGATSMHTLRVDVPAVT